MARILLARADALAELIARETGKLLADARGETVRAARIFDFFAGEALRNVGERFASTRPGVTVEVGHVPVGVVGRSEQHKSELPSLIRNSYAVICLKKNTTP